MEPLHPIELGTVSHGTLRTEDLLPIFTSLLIEYHPDGQTIANEVDELAENWSPEEALETAFNALDELAPEGVYFGAHPGDGSDFGFWRCEDVS